MTSDLTGSCFDDNTEELEERIRASFQNRGYFAAKLLRKAGSTFAIICAVAPILSSPLSPPESERP